MTHNEATETTQIIHLVHRDNHTIGGVDILSCENLIISHAHYRNRMTNLPVENNLCCLVGSWYTNNCEIIDEDYDLFIHYERKRCHIGHQGSIMDYVLDASSCSLLNG